MANRRMFSKKICRSAKFLKMPSESHKLYLHLVLDADDDGVVEAYSVMQAVSVEEQYFNILVEKGYIKVLNDDLVSYIMDWREHNVIRADRKVDSIYKDLLLEAIPGIKLVEPKKRASGKKKTSNQEKEDDNQMADNGLTNSSQKTDNEQTDGSQMSDNGQHKISQDKSSQESLEKEKLKKENIEEDNTSEISIEEIEKTEKDYKKIKIIFENSLEDITEENINECINYLKYFPIELVEYALIRTGMIKNPTWQYTKKILNSWLAKGINTLQQVKQDEKEFKKSNNVSETDLTDPNGFKRKGEELLKNDE